MTSVLHYRDPIAYRIDFMSASSYHSPQMDNIKRSPPYEGHSSESESRRQQTPGGSKKRPSRAGTRSVTTLTAAQLERKRANDREAQRAIRQRTKDHIDTLERQVRDLTAQLDSSSSTRTMELLRRNEELEQENAVLRARLGFSGSSLGVPEHGAATGVHSPSDRVQMLSHARRSSTGTARSVHSVPEISTPVSQPGHWQPQHTYTTHVPSPHVEGSTNMSDIHAQHQEAARWSPHPSGHPQHHPVSMPGQDHSVHAVESSGSNYPGSYGVESNARAMSYPLENPAMVSSQPMPMSGYGTPTSHASPHPSDYQRHISVPMSHQNIPQQGPYAHPQHHTSNPYTSYPNAPHQGYAPQGSHPGEMMVHNPHPQAQMVNEQGQHIVYHMQPNMKVEH